MSHFSVAVFSKEQGEYENLLAPYDENLTVVPYIEYTREQAIEYVRKNFNGMENESDDACYKYLAEDYSLVDEHGNLLTTYNPNSKWDWYEVGGRWRGFLKLPTGETCDEAYVAECVFSQDILKYTNAIRFWEAYVERGEEISVGDDSRALYTPQYYKDMYKTMEEYASSCASFLPYAFVTADGVWHDPGKMGWWGMSFATGDSRLEYKKEFNEYLEYAKKEGLYITVVDCHI